MLLIICVTYVTNQLCMPLITYITLLFTHITYVTYAMSVICHNFGLNSRIKKFSSLHKNIRSIVNTHKQDKSNLLNLNSNEEIPMHRYITSQPQKEPRKKKTIFCLFQLIFYFSPNPFPLTKFFP